MSKNESTTKICKHCQSEIPKKAKVCPNCRKKQGGILKWIIIGIVLLVIIGIAAGGGEDESKPKKTGEIAKQEKEQESEKTENSGEESKEETVDNVFHVGDIVETDDLKITYVASEQYVSDNEFEQPKEGYIYWKFEFMFENISDSDQTVSSLMDWECYADNAKVDQAWIGDDNGLDATLSSGRTTQGTIFYEIPAEAQSVELEYDINFWENDKIIFVGK